MEFLEEAQITNKVIDILKGKNAVCAVAFWGIHAKSFLEANSPNPAAINIVCDIHMGGTPAAALLGLQELGLKPRWRRGLHGKVFVSDVGAVVGSANASHNGLGVRGGPPFQPGYREAAVFLHPQADKDAYEAAREWARSQFAFDKSGNVGEVDEHALSIAKQRYRPLPPVHDFSENSLFDMVLAERKAFGNLAFVLTDDLISAPVQEQILGAIDASGDETIASRPEPEIERESFILMKPSEAQVCPPRFIHIWAPEGDEPYISLNQRVWRENEQGWVYAPKVNGSLRGFFYKPLPTRKYEIDAWLKRAAGADHARARQLLSRFSRLRTH